MVDYGEILINGKCNLNCFYCLGCEMDNDVYKPYNMHFSEWKNFKEWVNSLEGTPKIYISSTNSEPLLYPYLSELIEYLQYNGFKVGIRTNASLPKMDIVSKCDEEISVSLQSLEPFTFQKITGKPLTFDILDNINKIELKEGASLRVSIVVNRYNEFEIFSILNELKDIEKISYVQLRKVYKFIATDDFHDDLNAYLRISSYIKNVYQKLGNFKESEIFNVHGLHVSLWNDVFSSHSIKSSNYWTDGRMTLNNLLVPGYANAKVIEFYKSYDESKRLTSDNRHRLELYRKQYLYKNLLQNSKRVLQISCGTGVHTKFILDTFPDIELFASDLVPEHCQETAKLKYKNLRVFQWDCSQKKPNFIHNIDTILVEGAWYHLNKEQRQYLITNLMSLNPSLIVIDFLSELHEVQQRLLQDKKFINPENGIREPFFFDNRDDAENLAFIIYANNYNLSICPIDLDLRFGYIDLNNVPEEEFLKFVDYLNNTIRVSKDFETVNYTEHGCYIIR